LESGARTAGGASVDSGEIPSLGGEHLNAEGVFNFTSLKLIPRPFFESIRGGRIASRDILVVKDGATTGKTSFVGEDFPFHEAAVNEHVFCLRVDQSKACPEYVYHFLRSPHGQRSIALDFRGATVGGISRDFARKVRLPLPPLPEQRRIAAILDKADALRAKRRAALAKLYTLTQSIFLDMFGDPFEHRGDSVPLGEMADVLMGQSPPGASYNVAGDGTPLLNGPTEFGPRYPLEKQWTTEPTRLCAKGDILFCVRGATAGRLNRADKVYCLGRGLAAIRPRSGAPVSAEFLFAVLDRYYDYFQVKGVGSTFINISRQELESLPIPRSHRAQADALTRRVGAVENAKAAHVQSLCALESLFASLQHRAFRGEL